PSGTAYAMEACGVRQRRGSVRLHPGLSCDGRPLLRFLEASSREGDRRRKKTRRRSALAGTAGGLQLRHFSYLATKTRPVKERLTGRKRTAIRALEHGRKEPGRHRGEMAGGSI